MYTATTVTILRPSGLTETYDLSLGGGDITLAKQNLHNLLQQTFSYHFYPLNEAP